MRGVIMEEQGTTEEQPVVGSAGYGADLDNTGYLTDNDDKTDDIIIDEAEDKAE